MIADVLGFAVALVCCLINLQQYRQNMHKWFAAALVMVFPWIIIRDAYPSQKIAAHCLGALVFALITAGIVAGHKQAQDDRDKPNRQSN